MSDAQTVYEPWQPVRGQRVRIRLSAECQIKTYDLCVPPWMAQDRFQVLLRTHAGADNADNAYGRGACMDGHPDGLNGIEGTVTDIQREREGGHYYRVVFDGGVVVAIGPDTTATYLGLDLAASELEPA